MNDNDLQIHDYINKIEAENKVLNERLYRVTIGLPQFAMVYCSQCGGGFGPGNHGFSHCSDHSIKNDTELLDEKILDQLAKPCWSFDHSSFDHVSFARSVMHIVGADTTST